MPSTCSRSCYSCDSLSSLGLYFLKYLKDWCENWISNSTQIQNTIIFFGFLSEKDEGYLYKLKRLNIKLSAILPFSGAALILPLPARSDFSCFFKDAFKFIGLHALLGRNPVFCFVQFGREGRSAVFDWLAIFFRKLSKKLPSLAKRFGGGTAIAGSMPKNNVRFKISAIRNKHD